MDQRLITLSETVERGDPVPPMGFLVGSWMIQGTPVSYAKFYEASAGNLAQQLLDNMPADQKRQLGRNQSDAWAHLYPRAQRALAAFGDPGPDAAALNVVPAQAASGDTTLYIPALRIPIDAISSWFPVSFITHRQQATSWGIGVVIPF